jgi:cbb3-type cytochrome oxidase subunit 3
MHELPMLALIKQGVLVMFFLVFTALIWWTFLRSGNSQLEQHRYDIINEDRKDG